MTMKSRFLPIASGAACIAFFALASADESLVIPPKVHPKVSEWKKLFSEDLSDADVPEGI